MRGFDGTKTENDGGPLLIPYLAESASTATIASGSTSTILAGWVSTAGGQIYTSQSGGEWTMTYGGSYLFDIAITFGSGTAGARSGWILFKNGTEYRRYMPALAANGTVSATITVTCAANDVFSVRPFFGGTGSATLTATGGHRLGITRLSQVVN